MFRIHAAQFTLPAYLCLAGAISLLGLAGCSDDVEPPNQPPTAELTSGPVEGETVWYYIRIAWIGLDRDGYIQRFEYAVDPPSEFTEDEIANGGPGVTSTELHGIDGPVGITLVSKEVDGETMSFEWVHTKEHSHQFKFATPEADSTAEGGRLIPTGRFKGMHAVYVRAVDDDGAVSVPDRVAFTAETVAPRSQIFRPDISGYILEAGHSMIVGWDGIDPDSPNPNHKPVGFVFNLVDLDTVGPDPPIICLLYPCPPYERFLMRGPWTYQDSEISEIQFQLNVPTRYIFGVRAVDEAGAVEPFLDWGRNAFRFMTLENGGKPVITLSCNFGTFTCRGECTPQEMEVAANTEIRCTISCSAEDYGEECADWRWGVDVPDLDEDEGWSEWTTNPVLPPMLFANPGIHVLYIQARDTLGNTSLAVFILDVIEFPFDREMLFVDDSYDSVFPRDWEHDAFWRARIEGYGQFQPEQVGEFHAFGIDDVELLPPAVPRLEDLGRYKMVVWENLGAGFGAATSLNTATAQRPILSSYLSAGGKLWLGGRMTVGAMITDATGTRGDLVYPKGGTGGRPELKAGDFAYDFMKLHSTKIDNDKSLDTHGKNNLEAVAGQAGDLRADELRSQQDERGAGKPRDKPRRRCVRPPVCSHRAGFPGVDRLAVCLRFDRDQPSGSAQEFVL
jgi:hypothetical protein